MHSKNLNYLLFWKKYQMEEEYMWETKSDVEFYIVEVGNTTFRILRCYVNLRPIESEA